MVVLNQFNLTHQKVNLKQWTWSVHAKKNLWCFESAEKKVYNLKFNYMFVHLFQFQFQVVEKKLRDQLEHKFTFFFFFYSLWSLNVK